MEPPPVEEPEVPEAEVPAENEEPEPEIDIVISNVVCAFSVRCQLALKEIALQAANVEYKRENGMVTMKLRKPYTTASIWSSGKITCTGATSEDQVCNRDSTCQCNHQLDFCYFRPKSPLDATLEFCKSSTFACASITTAL